jgi:hypothetical protein
MVEKVLKIRNIRKNHPELALGEYWMNDDIFFPSLPSVSGCFSLSIILLIGWLTKLEHILKEAHRTLVNKLNIRSWMSQNKRITIFFLSRPTQTNPLTPPTCYLM